MGLADLLEVYSPELYSSLQRVQDRGGRDKKTFARRKGCFLAILNFLAGWVSGRPGSGTQRRRRLERIRERRLELEDTLPERGEAVVDWSSEEEPATPPSSHLEARSRSPPLPRPSSATSSGAGFQTEGSSGSVEVSGNSGDRSPRVRPPKPPTPRPKGPAGLRTPTPPPGRSAVPREPSVPPPATSSTSAAPSSGAPTLASSSTTCHCFGFCAYCITWSSTACYCFGLRAYCTTWSSSAEGLFIGLARGALVRSS